MGTKPTSQNQPRTTSTYTHMFHADCLLIVSSSITEPSEQASLNVLRDRQFVIRPHAGSNEARTAVPPRRLATQNDLEIAVICALKTEADAVLALFDCRWDEPGWLFRGDTNAYTFGAIGRHNVVLIHMPHIGKVKAATAAAHCQRTFPNIGLALIVGVCGAVPFTSTGEEILLGDVIISERVVQYDFGRQYTEGFVLKDTPKDALAAPNNEISGLLSKLKTYDHRKELQEQIALYIRTVQDHPGLGSEYPGVEYDKRFPASYRHATDDISCEDCCDLGKLMPPSRLSQEPAVHIGMVASSDKVMRSANHRDAIARSSDVIGFEMEGAGVWGIFPCVVIKGVCDYADSHKAKGWQQYAAVTAAACMKAFLDHWRPSGRKPAAQTWCK